MSTESELDPLTIAALAVLSYVGANVIHEGLGHGGACWALSGRCETWSAVSFQCGYDGLVEWRWRLIAAAGALANLAAAAVFYGAWRKLRGAGDAVRYFFWLSAAVNVLQFGGYLLFLYPFGLGDGAAFADFGWPWKAAFAVIGLLALYWGGNLARGELRPYLACDGPELSRQTGLLARMPYAAGCAAVCLAGVPNPGGLKFLFLSAVPSTVFGTTRLRKMRFDFGAPGGPVLHIPRNWPVILAAAAIFAAFIAFVGPGFRFH